MQLPSLFTALAAAAPFVVRALPGSSIFNKEELHEPIVEARGFGRLKIPLFLSLLPENMTFTVDEININIPTGMEAWREGGPAKTPFIITTAEVNSAIKKGWRGVYMGELAMQTGGSGFGGGPGSSFNIKYTVGGRSPQAVGTAVQNTKGTLTVSTSEWGTFGRPDYTLFSWQTGDSGWGTWSAKTPTLTSPDDTFITIAYCPDNKSYVFGLTTDGPAVTKFLRGVISGIIGLHALALSAGSSSLGTIASVGIKVALWAPRVL